MQTYMSCRVSGLITLYNKYRKMIFFFRIYLENSLEMHNRVSLDYRRQNPKHHIYFFLLNITQQFTFLILKCYFSLFPSFSLSLVFFLLKNQNHKILPLVLSKNAENGPVIQNLCVFLRFQIVNLKVFALRNEAKVQTNKYQINHVVLTGSMM